MNDESEHQASVAWRQRLKPYAKSNNARAMWELVVTFVPFVGLFGLSAAAFNAGYWSALILTLPTAAFLVRLFAIQHDCGHGAFFTSRRANDWLGRILGILTFTPYDDWRREHALHHTHSGNLSRRGFGDITTLTSSEYGARNRSGRWLYWLYRQPVVLFVIGPAWQFLLRHRWPTGKTGNWMPWISVLSTNLGILIYLVVLGWLIGWTTLLAIQVPVTIIGATIGVWLFYVQHQFEGTYWKGHEEWNGEQAALHGSTYYDLPQPLMWITGNIGIHHVHHISSKIPFHVLPEVILEHPQFQSIGRISLLESLRTIPLALWDEDRQKLISFRENRQLNQK